MLPRELGCQLITSLLRQAHFQQHKPSAAIDRLSNPALISDACEVSALLFKNPRIEKLLSKLIAFKKKKMNKPFTEVSFHERHELISIDKRCGQKYLFLFLCVSVRTYNFQMTTTASVEFWFIIHN